MNRGYAVMLWYLVTTVRIYYYYPLPCKNFYKEDYTYTDGWLDLT